MDNESKSDVYVPHSPMQWLTYNEAFAADFSGTAVNAAESKAENLHDVTPFTGEATGTMRKLDYEGALLRAYGSGIAVFGYPAIFDERHKRWVANCSTQEKAVRQCRRKTESNDAMLETESYRETPEGLVMKLQNGEEKRITNVWFRIKKEVLRYRDQDNILKYYAVEVHSASWDCPKLLESIAKEKMKDLFELIKREYGDVYILANAPKAREVLEIYRTDVFRLSQQSWKTVKIAARRGWIKMEGKITYEPGDNSYYNTSPIPYVSEFTLEQRRKVFQDGNRILDVGRRGATISILTAFAHLGFSNYFLEMIGIPCQFILFLHGETGSGKTQICRLITNVFETDRSKKNLRFSGTDASFAEVAEMVRDACILIDDFSATNMQTLKEALKTFEKRIRVAGDRDLPSKMRNGRLYQAVLRIVLLMTGETEVAGIAKSSALRSVNALLRKADVDWSVLSEFQEHREYMTLYFACFILFLTERMPSLLPMLKAEVRRLRAASNPFKEARLRDAAIIFAVQTILIREFAMWMGLSVEEAELATAPFAQIPDVLKENARASRLFTAAERFLIGFQQAANEFTGSSIAKNEEEYATDEAAFVGFYTEDALWLNFEKATGIVKKFYCQQGEEVVISPDQIKKQLYEAKILRASKNSRGTMDYVKRAKKGSRKRMVVLGKVAMENALEKLLKEDYL